MLLVSHKEQKVTVYLNTAQKKSNALVLSGKEEECAYYKRHGVAPSSATIYRRWII